MNRLSNCPPNEHSLFGGNFWCFETPLRRKGLVFVASWDIPSCLLLFVPWVPHSLCSFFLMLGSHQAFAEEEAIFKRSTSRQLYNTMSAVKVGRFRAPLKSSPSTEENLISPSSNDRKIGQSKRIARTPSQSTSAEPVSSMVSASRHAVASSDKHVVSKRSTQSSTPEGLFSSADHVVRQVSGTKSIGSVRSSVSSSISGSLSGTSQQSMSISARSVSPSLAEAVKELKAIHKMHVTKDMTRKPSLSIPPMVTKPLKSKRKAAIEVLGDDSGDDVQVVSPPAKKQRLSLKRPASFAGKPSTMDRKVLPSARGLQSFQKSRKEHVTSRDLCPFETNRKSTPEKLSEWVLWLWK